MLLYYISRIRDNNTKKIINEATNSYINNIKQNIELKKNNTFNIDLDSETETKDYKDQNYGLILFVSFISFVSGFSFGRKSIL
jgi:hypothetical protein